MCKLRRVSGGCGVGMNVLVHRVVTALEESLTVTRNAWVFSATLVVTE